MALRRVSEFTVVTAWTTLLHSRRTVIAVPVRTALCVATNGSHQSESEEQKPEATNLEERKFSNHLKTEKQITEQKQHSGQSRNLGQGFSE
jgi:hypothetical protein